MKKLFVYAATLLPLTVVAEDTPPEASYQKFFLSPLSAPKSPIERTMEEFRKEIDKTTSIRSGPWQYSLRRNPRVLYTDPTNQSSYELKAEDGRVIFNYNNGRFSVRGERDRIMFNYKIPLSH